MIESPAHETAAPAETHGVTRAFAPFEWMVAGRYLRARRREGFISVIAGFSFVGIMLGVATLIIVLSVMNGFRKELYDKIIGINGHVFVQARERPLDDYGAVAERISKLPLVRYALPMVEGQALASSPANAGGVLVRGLREGDIRKVGAIVDNLQNGSLEGFDAKGGVAIGSRLAEQLILRTGDTITLTAPNGAETPFGTTPRIKAYPVVAVFEIGMSEFDAAFVYMPLAESQAYFNREGDVTAIEVYLNDPDRTDEAVAAIEGVAGRPITITDWRFRNRTFFAALAVERNVMFLILSLIVLVAALNIVSGLIMLVKDKGADIAILRTMGATSGAIMRIFLITGAAIGVVGTFAGFLLGLVITLNLETIRSALFPDTFPKALYFLSRLPAELNPPEVVAVVLIALVLSLLATLYPSWRAARLDPVEALRYE